MKLEKHILLSKKHRKICDYHDNFFVPALNALYWLHTEMKFLKPRLSTCRGEALLEFPGRDISVSVEFCCYDGNIDVLVRGKVTPRSKDFKRHFLWPTNENGYFIVNDLFQFLKSVIPDLKSEIMNRIADLGPGQFA